MSNVQQFDFLVRLRAPLGLVLVLVSVVVLVVVLCGGGACTPPLSRLLRGYDATAEDVADRVRFAVLDCDVRSKRFASLIS